MRSVGLFVIAAAWFFGLVASLPAGEESRTAAIIADLRENNLSAEEILGVTSLDSVRIVSLETLSGTDLQTLDETLRATEDGFGEIRAAVEANEVIEAELKEREVSISRIVAITRSETGAITVYTGEQSL